MVNYGSKLLKGAGIIFFMSLLSAGLGYGIRIILAKNLSTADFGLFFAVYNIVLMLGWMKGFSFTSVVQKFIPGFKAKGDYTKIKSMFIFVLIFTSLTSLLLVILIYLFPEHLINSYFKSNVAKSLLWIITLFYIIDDFSKLVAGYFLSVHLPFLYSLRDLLVRLSLFLLLFVVTINTFSVAWLYVVAAALALVVNLLLFIRYFPFQYKTSITKDLVRKLFSFSTPLIIRDFFGVFLSRVDNLFLVYFRPLTEVAIYNTILPTAELLLFISRPFAKVLFPLSSELWFMQDKRRLRSLLGITHKYLLLLLIPLALFVGYLSTFILSQFFGSVYVEGSFGLRILIVGILFSSLNLVGYAVLKGIGKTKEVAVIHIFINSLNVILNIILIPLFGSLNQGYFGAIIATTCSFFVAFLLLTYFLHKFLHYRLSLAILLFIVTSGFASLLIMHVIVTPISSLYVQLAVFIVGFSLLYLVFIFVLKITSKQEIVTLLKMLRSS